MHLTRIKARISSKRHIKIYCSNLKFSFSDWERSGLDIATRKMGFISRLKAKVDSRSAKKPRKLDLGKPIDHQALCMRSSLAMIGIAAVVYALVPRLSFLNGGDPSKHAIKLYQQGNMYYAKGNLIEAERHFRQAVHINPRHAFALSNLVIMHSSDLWNCM